MLSSAARTSAILWRITCSPAVYYRRSWIHTTFKATSDERRTAGRDSPARSTYVKLSILLFGHVVRRRDVDIFESIPRDAQILNIDRRRVINRPRAHGSVIVFTRAKVETVQTMLLHYLFIQIKIRKVWLRRRVNNRHMTNLLYCKTIILSIRFGSKIYCI